MTPVAAAIRQPEPAESTEPVGDLIAHALAELGVTTVFGVISIHNMPILDAIARQGRIRFVPSRSEAGAMNMADAFARVSRSLGVLITSTGTAAGNAAGSQVEALTAGSPVLHITSQIDRPFMDRDRAAIHDVPRQADMLKAVSKAFFRVWEGRTAVGMVEAAARAALTAPRGPVSLEIPIDVQRERLPRPRHVGTGPIVPQAADPQAIDLLAEMVRRAKRPMLWLGGGAREAIEPARDLAERGFAIVTSTNGRAVVPEAHRHTLGAYNMTPEAQALFDRADLMIVVGSRLRGNETRNNMTRLPKPLIQIDADRVAGRAQLSGRPVHQRRRRAGAVGAGRAAAEAARCRCQVPARRRRRPHAVRAQGRVGARALSRGGRRAARARAARHASVRARRDACRTAPSATAMYISRRRISACMRSAAASGRGWRWRSAPRSPASPPRRSRCSATAAPWSISANSPPRSIPAPTSSSS